MGILLCEQNFRNVWIRNESVRAEIGQILYTDIHTTAAKLVVRITSMALKYSGARAQKRIKTEWVIIFKSWGWVRLNSSSCLGPTVKQLWKDTF